jgi:hypothetical protein
LFLPEFPSVAEVVFACVVVFFHHVFANVFYV